MFLYNDPGHSGKGDGFRDVIADLGRGNDRLDLGSVDANATVAGNQAFEWIGLDDFSGAGQLRASQRGDSILLRADLDGDAKADFEIWLEEIAMISPGDIDL